VTRRYKGRPRIAHDFRFIVEIAVTEGGLGKRLNDMHAFHNQRGIQVAHIRHRHEDDRDRLRWRIARRAIAKNLRLNLAARRWDDPSRLAHQPCPLFIVGVGGGKKETILAATSIVITNPKTF